MINIIREFISNWIKSLVVLMIIISIVDMVMPKGNMKRYVNFIVGLIIVFSIINPFARLTNSNLSFEQEVNSLSGEIYNEFLIESQDEQIESVYLGSLKSEIRNFLESNTDYIINSVDITTSTEEEGNFIIDEIFIELTINRSSDLNKEIKINKIDIGDTKRKGEYLAEEPNVKNLIANHLQLDKNKIKISIEDKEDKYGGNTE
ncbi:MAG: stage III sporulation protein AF [Tissierellia bacterium]|nr:stage III sporulation protein AF [Tissierellia bacterium]MDD4726153.1 stage III sporulation protein AF [Tissierellia bacterium]